MAEPFDPFCEWLAIEPDEHPVDHYRLLGIRRFESNPEMIEAAADERMKIIRTFQTGPRGRFTQPILNALSQARLCLLDPDERATYEDQLRSVEQVAIEQPAEFPMVEIAARDLYWTIDDLGIRERSKTPWIAAVLVLVAAVGIGLLIRDNRSSRGTAAATDDNQPGEVVENPPEEGPVPIPVKQEGDGSFHLSPSTAELEGKNMQLDLEKNQVYGWKNKDDLVYWKIDVATRGYFEVKVTYAAEAPWEGEYIVQLDDEKPIFMEVNSTGSNIGHLRIQDEGVHSLTLWTEEVVGDELMMMLKLIELTPSLRK